MRFARVLVLLTCLQAAAQTPTELLDQIRRRMTDNLLHLPDYTCRETIERTQRNADSKRYRLLDRLRLDVAYVGGKELYAWPGAPKFEEIPLDKIVDGGAIGNGTFGGFAREVFSSMAPKFFWGGYVERDGGRFVRFTFRVALEKSRYVLRREELGARVAYSGFFEADPLSLAPARFEIDAEAIPASLQLRSAGQLIRFGETRIGESRFLLPLSAEMWLERDNGEEDRNTTRFESCRQYSGESTLRFDVVENDAAAAAALDKPIQIPKGLTLQADLQESITYATAARGDVVHAIVTSAVKHSGQVVIPKGAVITARITSLGTRSVRSMTYFSAGLAFLRIDFAGRHGDFSALIEGAGVGSNYSAWDDLITLKTPTPQMPGNLRLLLRTK